MTKAKLEALFETAGMGKNSDGAKQLADPEVSKFNCKQSVRKIVNLAYAEFALDLQKVDIRLRS